MVTKKQHYYPRTLIKHFANEDKRLYAFIRMENKVQYKNYQDVCYHNYTYEGSSGRDNILENKLSLLEGKLAPIIDKIVNNINQNRVSVNLKNTEIDFLYKYIFLQYIRTDSGRIRFIRGFGNMKYISKKYQYKIDEINDSKNREILEFNDRFKQEGVLENLVNYIVKPNFMNFHIVIGENFITSDNPVIGLDEGMQLYMPISSNFCIAFQHDFVNCSREIPVEITSVKEKFINECQIETANYYIMSSKNFDLNTNWYIYRRFHEKDWEKKSKHYK